MSSVKHSDIADRLGTAPVIFWFRRDLRLEDNAGLYHALKGYKEVIPIFIFDSLILDQLEDKQDARVTFIHQAITELDSAFRKYGSSLVVLNGDPVALIKAIKPHVLITNEDYEPYARKRDGTVSDYVRSYGGIFESFKDQVIFSRSEVVKDNNEPYTVFTPYSKKWKSRLNKFYLKPYPVERYAKNLKKLSHVSIPSLQELGFEKASVGVPPPQVDDLLIKKYQTTREFPGMNGTSRLGVHLRFGTVSIRHLASMALTLSETWLNELIWREFYQMILWHFPHVETSCFKPAYNNIRWRNNEEEFERWCNGTTGYPIVDAGMRELNVTGFMHNRVRMIVASFLTKHLLIDWRWGEAYFAKKLLDFDLASNNGGWQWAAGCGCDAAPYFRVFNPTLQTEKFDKDLEYVRRWVPEYQTDTYPKPIVDHRKARERVLAVYQKALNKV